MKHYFIYILLCLMIVSGCSSEAQEGNNVATEEASYVGFVNIEGENYSAHEFAENGEYTIVEELGEIKKKVPAEEIPKENLTSNYFEEGTKVFSVKEDPEIFLVKDLVEGQDKYHIMKKNP
ncbi:hypothetical protein A1A1_14269 [Planococcus antarcticus DSM 14505]|uniref:Lipoprotein n=1 Tax=Planococcus antarcticus DSM 14505 TaxID=1185653 RepID=A0AA87IIZ7_9BACL|nr:hypothetical protein [Planococcus antarcticus]EIM05810.1 hypothetical protein A1A1_14269 [Planococcus antarcticus DSM 14505]